MLAPSNYVQWKSRIKRYIDTKPNNELIHYCLQNPPYKFKWAERTIPVAEGSSETTAEGYMKNYKNVSQDIRNQLDVEVVQIILTGIDDDIYSTVDACPNAYLETNLYWEFGKFTSQDGETLESYYSNFYKMMNELVRNQCDVTNHQVNVQFLLQLQPKWQRFVILVKQSQELKTITYYKLYDILKQHQNEVNEIRAERLARTANPLALVAQQQPVYHPQNHRTHYNQNSSTRPQQAATRNRGKAIVNSRPPTYDQEPEMVAEDDALSKKKEIDKLMALISLSFKKIYKLTNNNLRTSSNISRANQDNTPRINKETGYDNQKIVNVVGARENVGTQVVHQSVIQCYNCKEYGHVARECQKPKWAKDAAYHKEKMILYSRGDHSITTDSLDMSNNRGEDDQDKDEDLARERDLLASLIKKLKCEIDESKDHNKLLESSNKTLVNKLKSEIEDFKNKNKSLESSNNHFKKAITELAKNNQLMFKDLKKFQAELDRYHDVNYASKVEIDCAKAKGELISYKMSSEKSFNEYTRKIDDLNQMISEKKKELIAHQEIITIMSQEKEAQQKFYKTREDKEIEKVIALENKVKILDDIIYKTGQSVQIMNMLNRNCKTNFVKPEFLKKAQRVNPRLYDIEFDGILVGPCYDRIWLKVIYLGGVIELMCFNPNGGSLVATWVLWGGIVESEVYFLEVTTPSSMQLDEKIASGDESNPCISKSTRLPRKRFYRARAHSNPLSDSHFPVPVSPHRVEYPLHYPHFYPSSELQSNPKKIEFADIGCGFGGLLISLATLFPETLMVGMELRDKVTEYVKERILALRVTNPGQYQNVSVVRTNSMKYIPNYFEKAQLSKMFFLFPDPHFKEKNHRRRVISPFLLDEYAYVIRPGGIIYTITDVEELGEWMKSCLENHPLFEALTEEELEADPVVKLLSSATEEGQKVSRNCPCFHFYNALVEDSRWLLLCRLGSDLDQIVRINCVSPSHGDYQDDESVSMYTVGASLGITFDGKLARSKNGLFSDFLSELSDNDGPLPPL
ncbi:integrase, catalytic region, zinc finger, CCHC-type containing protein [Tanacetum coccineum]